MSSALLDAPARHLHSAGGRRPTLAELLDGTLRSARGPGEADCPLCDGAMHLADGVARCDGCGTTLT
jgi:hypothetical protein